MVLHQGLRRGAERAEVVQVTLRRVVLLPTPTGARDGAPQHIAAPMATASSTRLHRLIAQTKRHWPLYSAANRDVARILGATAQHVAILLG